MFILDLHPEATKVEKEYVEEQIVEVEYHDYHDKVVVCLIHMSNGFLATGIAGVVDPKNFVLEKGQEIAYKEALNNVWAGMGYMLQEELHNKHRVNATT